MSRTCTSGRHGVPSLMIRTLPVVKAQAARLLSTTSRRTRAEREGRARPRPARRDPRPGPCERGRRVTLLAEEDLREVEPAVRWVPALHSPATGIVDFRLVARCLAEEIVGRGAAIRLREAVHGMSRSGDRAVRLATTAGSVEAGRTPFWRWRGRAIAGETSIWAICRRRCRRQGSAPSRVDTGGRGSARCEDTFRSTRSSERSNVSCLRCAPNIWPGRTAGSGLRRSRTTGGSSTTSGSTAPTEPWTCATPLRLRRRRGWRSPKRSWRPRASFRRRVTPLEGILMRPRSRPAPVRPRRALPPLHAPRTSLCGFARSSPPPREV
jgi:hypothetical protein